MAGSLSRLGSDAFAKDQNFTLAVSDTVRGAPGM
jgi:hypothetical protein